MNTFFSNDFNLTIFLLYHGCFKVMRKSPISLALLFVCDILSKLFYTTLDA
ncbi:hypothetical protein LEQ41_04865 [Streptococcus agalactiae]|nr:hypothetical protein [Streptococcus agalactiae]